jgi:hypothetical protein
MYTSKCTSYSFVSIRSRDSNAMHIAERTYPAHDRHDPPAGIIVENHVAFPWSDVAQPSSSAMCMDVAHTSIIENGRLNQGGGYQRVSCILREVG